MNDQMVPVLFVALGLYATHIHANQLAKDKPQRHAMLNTLMAYGSLMGLTAVAFVYMAVFRWTSGH